MHSGVNLCNILITNVSGSALILESHSSASITRRLISLMRFCRRNSTNSAPFVENLARRIASFPAHAIAHAKAAVDAGAFGSMAEGLLVEAHESDLSVASEVTQARVK
jgi:hypothetical protein